MSDGIKTSRIKRWLSEFSLPLIAGVVAALVLSNTAPEFYHQLTHAPLAGMVDLGGDHGAAHETHGADQHHATDAHHAADSHHGSHASDSHHDSHASDSHDSHATDSHDSHASDSHAAAAHDSHGDGHGWGHYLTMHFLVNDLFMVLFFGIAAKEITESCLPNGSLNPVSKAVNPLFATLGGILGPVGVYLLLNSVMGQSAWTNGWGIPTATDIALAWLVAKLIFGGQHPAISFLLLLAVADDAIGLGIIAIAYPDPNHPAEWMNLCWVIPGIAAAYGFRRANVTSWLPYIVVGGAFCWWGLYSAHLHPALALVFIVPFLPGPKLDHGLYAGPSEETAHHHGHSPLERFEHDLRLFVDCGLFFFALANAGVSFGEVNNLTWIVVLSLLVGKTVGVTAFSLFATRLGFPLAKGMEFRHLLVTAVISGLGLTVALFVSGQAFVDAGNQAAAKMGAVLSAAAALVAYVFAIALGIVKVPALRLPFGVKAQQPG